MARDIKNIDEAGKILLKKRKTLAVAESVTAGNLQAALSLATYAQLFFQGGITMWIGIEQNSLRIQ